MNLKRVINLAAGAALAASLLAGCTPKPSQSPAPGGADDTRAGEAQTEAREAPPAGSSSADYKYGKVDIPGKVGSLCNAPTYIAYEKGFFAEEGFDVTLISSNAENSKLGLSNGTIPIVNGDFQFFPSIEEGVNMKVVDGLHNGCIKLLVPKDSAISGVNDLKGKKVGVDEIGGTPHQVAAVWLEKNGISAKPADGEVQFLPFDDGNLEIEALNKGEIDVAAVWDPFGSVQEKTGNYKVILDISTDEPFAGRYCCFLYASGKIAEEKPDEIAALLRAYHKAQDWIAENPEEAVKIIIDGKYSAIEDEELAAQLLGHYEYPTESEHAMNTRDVGADVLYFATQLHDIGYLKTDPEDFTAKAYQKVDLTLGE
ncbi:MAG: ABC transporter substrate-binding protein [Clostridiales bacterium]|nr:ABC transporter substrate-binding protein [Clostridiales bacterium]